MKDTCEHGFALHKCKHGCNDQPVRIEVPITDAEVKARVKSCLTFMMMGGLRASLFTDTPEEDLTSMIEAEVLTLPNGKAAPASKAATVFVAIEAIKEWREKFIYLKDVPDQ